MKFFNLRRLVILLFVVVAAIALVLEKKAQIAPKINRVIDSAGLCTADDSVQSAQYQPPPILMDDHSSWLGQVARRKTFSIAVADLNDDNRDDIIVGNHGQNPYLFINKGSSFSNQSKLLFPKPLQDDRHGYSLADLDNDGDLDIAVSGGGEDGVGKGSANILLENLSEQGELSFAQKAVPDNLAAPASRSRSLIPVASRNGSMVDLYLATLKRAEYPNSMLLNTGDNNIFEFQTDPESPFTVSINDHGRGVFADFDNDGKADYLTVAGSSAILYRSAAPGESYETLADLAYSLKAADFNNDGALDIFIGRFSPPTNSDRISHDNEKLIYVVHENGTDSDDAVSFKTQSNTLDFDLEQHIQATEERQLDGARGIFLGREKLKPESRRFTATTEQATGAPLTLDDPGIYIWHDGKTNNWEIRWHYPDFLKLFKGVITAKGISKVVTSGLDQREQSQVNDYLFINDGNGNFTRHCNIESQHNAATVASAVADFNNDGWLDLIGVRHGEQGDINGNIFVLNNSNGKYFSGDSYPVRKGDRLHRADLVAYGFFDGDDKPDVVVTNGYGQIPGTRGPTQLLLNKSNTEHPAILIRIKGVGANRFGVGAKLTLKDSADNILGHRVQGLNSNISQDTYWQHFGLGNSQGPYTVLIVWPDKSTTQHVIDGPGRHVIQQ